MASEAERAYNRSWYARNKERIGAVKLARSQAVRRRNRALARRAKDRPCADCGVTYPSYVMQFDHLGDKKFSIADACGQGFSEATLLAEMDKCEVVCANCHAARTYQRRHRELV